MKKALSTGILIGITILITGSAWAQIKKYPNKPIRLVVPFSPGGGVDTIARLFVPQLSAAVGENIVVDNRGGASGNIGSELVARSAPDGYTLMIHTLPFVTNTFLYRRMPYDVLRDFSPISLISSAPSVLTVNPSLPVHSIAELLKLARSKPGELNYASAGIGTNPHIAGELLNFLAKVNIMAVHFKGAGPGLIATMSGEVKICFSNIAQTTSLVKAKRLRALGVSSAKRSPALPDVPTIAEEGVPGYEFVTWNGLLAPRGTPKAIVIMLDEKFRKIMADPEIERRFHSRGLDIITSSPDEFSAHLRSELKKWERVLKERNMHAD